MAKGKLQLTTMTMLIMSITTPAFSQGNIEYGNFEFLQNEIKKIPDYPKFQGTVIGILHNQERGDRRCTYICAIIPGDGSVTVRYATIERDKHGVLQLADANMHIKTKVLNPMQSKLFDLKNLKFDVGASGAVIDGGERYYVAMREPGSYLSVIIGGWAGSSAQKLKWLESIEDEIFGREINL